MTKGDNRGDGPIPELIQLGERLAAARREQGLSVEELAGRLRLGSEQLLALEAGDHAHLPEAVFVVAQAKRVAGALGIDVSRQIDQLHASCLMRPGRGSSGTAVVLARPPLASRRNPPPKPRPTLRQGAWLALALLALGGAAVTLLVLRERWPATASAPAPSPGRPAPAPPSAAVQAPSPAAPDQLQVQSLQPSWLEVRDGKGVVLFRGLFRGERTFPLGPGLKLLAGRPDLVRVRTGGGAPAPLGRIDQVEWRSFSPSSAAP